MQYTNTPPSVECLARTKTNTDIWEKWHNFGADKTLAMQAIHVQRGRGGRGEGGVCSKLQVHSGKDNGGASLSSSGGRYMRHAQFPFNYE